MATTMAAFEHYDPDGACKQGEGSPCPVCEFIESLWNMIVSYSYEVSQREDCDETAHADVVRANEAWSKAEGDLCQLLADASRAIAEHRGNRDDGNEHYIAHQLAMIYTKLDGLRVVLEVFHPAGDA